MVIAKKMVPRHTARLTTILKGKSCPWGADGTPRVRPFQDPIGQNGYPIARFSTISEISVACLNCH